MKSSDQDGLEMLEMKIGNGMSRVGFFALLTVANTCRESIAKLEVAASILFREICT